MFGLFKTFRAAREAQRGLTEAFRARGKNFMTMESTVHEALVKEAIATGVEATIQHFDRVELYSSGRAWKIIEHYKKRGKQFEVKR